MESVAEATDVQTRTRAVDPCIFSVTGATLKVRDIMSRELVTAGPMDTVLVAAKRMSENNISCVIVTDGGRGLGAAVAKATARHRFSVAVI